MLSSSTEPPSSCAAAASYENNLGLQALIPTLPPPVRETPQQNCGQTELKIPTPPLLPYPFCPPPLRSKSSIDAPPTRISSARLAVSAESVAIDELGQSRRYCLTHSSANWTRSQVDIGTRTNGKVDIHGRGNTETGTGSSERNVGQAAELASQAEDSDDVPSRYWYGYRYTYTYTYT